MLFAIYRKKLFTKYFRRFSRNVLEDLLIFTFKKNTSFEQINILLRGKISILVIPETVYDSSTVSNTKSMYINLYDPLSFVFMK